jgi:hypothetical protein
MLEQASGHTRSIKSIGAKAIRMGIRARTNGDGVAVADAAKELGINGAAILDMARRGVVSLSGKSWHRFLSYDDYDMLAEKYRRPEEPVMPIKEAAKLLGYDPQQVTIFIKSGLLKGCTIGNRWFATVQSVKSLAREMKARRTTRLRIPDTPEIIEMRRRKAEKVREYRNARRTG